MNYLKNFIIALALGLILTGTIFAGEGRSVKDSARVIELKNQAVCPVMGGKIDSTTYTDIQGQRVYHCCPMCSEKLKADPGQYFKKAAAEGVLFENIQTACPVTGEKLEKKTAFMDYEGRRIYFCCENCIKTFNGDPQKYLKKLDEKSPSENSAGNMSGMKQSCEDHSH